jgi:hypothetical protein
MWISSITLENFRCFKSLSLTPSKELNIFVGENNVGKTSVFIALSKLINAIWPKAQEPFKPTDMRQRHVLVKPLSVTCTFSLDMNDKRDIVDLFSPKDFDLATKRLLKQRMNSINILDTLEVGLRWSQQSTTNYLKLGPLYIQPNNALTSTLIPSGTAVSLDAVARSLVSSEYSKALETIMHAETKWAASNLRDNILTTLTPRFSYFSEYRGKPARMQRTPLLESLEGSQTASVLLNLKNHTDRRQRNRYIGIKHAFASFFPQLKIEAVETAPSSTLADIQFAEIGNSYSVPTENVGAGVLELLTLLTNLVTLHCYVFVIEEPELHLHPHMKRSLVHFIRHSSARNQIFVITHDPIFIDPDFIPNLCRFYPAGKNTGTLAASLSTSTGLSAQDIGQISTASKDIKKRELYFARAVLFVEDESQQKFIEGCAEKLQLGLDSFGISIIEVGGKDGFKPYITLAKQLDIPFLCLADLPWGSSPDRPPKTYRSLGSELEQYLEQAGCRSLMDQARQAVGNSKQRVAKYCGENIAVSCIPDLFRQLLHDTVKLCKKHPKRQ